MASGDTFADRLTQLMRAQHLSVPGFRKELGDVVSERTIWRWRSGKAVPGIEALPFLARALNTTPNHLVGWEEGEA